ncbi:DUF6059 family protein [Streptomyces sp. 184]|uniref:DUF6059 family protein n=1 Tax=Streptomyces sp. 184 TaxID=1827526 RepID=UPI0038922FB9
MAGFFKRVLHEVYEALKVSGSLHVAGPWIPSWLPSQADDGPPRLDEPPAGHPERLCPGTALTPAERALERELNRGP